MRNFNRPYGVAENSPTDKLLADIDDLADAHGLRFDRWQSNGNLTTTITYVIHEYSHRPQNSAEAIGDNQGLFVKLMQREGLTERSTAHKELSELSKELWQKVLGD